MTRKRWEELSSGLTRDAAIVFSSMRCPLFAAREMSGSLPKGRIRCAKVHGSAFNGMARLHILLTRDSRNHRQI